MSDDYCYVFGSFGGEKKIVGVQVVVSRELLNEVSSRNQKRITGITGKFRNKVHPLSPLYTIGTKKYPDLPMKNDTPFHRTLNSKAVLNTLMTDLSSFHSLCSLPILSRHKEYPRF